LLNANHQLAGFDCGHPDLNNWLSKRALTHQGEGASRTYVVTDGQRIAGYYALAAGGINIAAAPGRFRRNMPFSASSKIVVSFALCLRPSRSQVRRRCPCSREQGVQRRHRSGHLDISSP
jgi:hypothetical protein